MLKLLASLVIAPDLVHGGGQLVNGLASAIGRRARRRLRRVLEGTSLEAITALDFTAWLAEVRALAAASVLDETHGDLRIALLACVVGRRPTPRADLPGAEADLTPLVAAHAEARALLARVVRSWLDRVAE